MQRVGVSCLILSAVFFLQAQTINIRGSVTNALGDAVPNAVVILESKDMSDTTGLDGQYTLFHEATPARNVKISAASEIITIKNNILKIRLPESESIKLEFFDMRGNKVGERVERPATTGICRIDLNGHVFAASLLLVRVSVGEDSFRFRYLPVNGEMYNVGTSGVLSESGIKLLAKTNAVDDSLRVSALGYRTKTVPISSYEALVDITLDPIDMSGCTESDRVNRNVSGSGPHQVVVETNADRGIREGTIYRPADLGPGKNYPLFVWGEGGCSLDGTSNSTAMAEIASHGYVVIADGTPGGSGGRPMEMSQGAALLAYIDWIIAQNRKPCSIYYQSIDTAKIAANGFSCGGMLAMGTAHDPRITTWGLTSSGSFGDNHSLWNSVHTPVLILEGEQDATGAYANGKRDYYGITALGHPVMFFSNRNMGHGGDLWGPNGGDFTRINLAWLNWWLKDDEGPTGKGMLVGGGCSYCSDRNWEAMFENLP